MSESNLVPLRNKDITAPLVLRRAADRADDCDIAVVITRTKETGGWRVQFANASWGDLTMAAFLVNREATQLCDKAEAESE